MRKAANKQKNKYPFLFDSDVQDVLYSLHQRFLTFFYLSAPFGHV